VHCRICTDARRCGEIALRPHGGRLGAASRLPYCATADLAAFLHVIDHFSARFAHSAHVRTAEYRFVELCAEFHEEGLAQYISAQPNVSHMCGDWTRPAHGQPTVRERREAVAMARIDSTSHLLVNRVRVSSL
jgi:hypothetical protein